MSDTGGPIMYRTRAFKPVTSGPDGTLIQHLGRYAREAVLTAFGQNGGVDWLADWARKNPDAFFTRVFPKIITKEIEVQATGNIDELIRRLDAGETAQVITQPPRVVEEPDDED